MTVPVITDSGTGFNAQQAAALNIDFLPLQVTIDDKTYLDGVDLDIDTLYDALEDGKIPTTSLPPLGLIEDLMEKYEKEGVKDIILLTLSNGLSSTNSAVSASAKAHGINVYTTDTYTTLGVQRYLAKAAALLARDGVEPAEIMRRIEKAVDGSSGYLIASDLDYLARGGRLTPTAAKLGGMLKIKPILIVGKESEGKVGVHEKVRTMSKAVKKAAEQVISELDPNQEYKLIVLDSRNRADSDLAEMLLKEAFPEADISRESIYAVIAAHTGMEAVGLQFVPKIEGVEI